MLNQSTRARSLGLMLSAGLAGTLAGTTASADWYEDLSSSVKDGKASFDFRLRNEIADLDSFGDSARASTLRSRLTWKSAPIGAWSYGAEADYVAVIGSERYNSLSNGMTRYPVIADPDGFDLNQIYVAYSGDALSSTFGRQRINHDRQRFVGGVAWRQNEQSLDALRFQFGDTLKFDYSYVSRVNRIFGPDDGVQPRQWDSNSHFLRGTFSPAKGHSMVAFGYLMDFENGNGIPNSNSTFGIEYTGKVGAIQLAAALAQQSDYGDSALDYDAPYYFAEAKYATKQFGVTVGYEVLGSDGGTAGFRTPLATLHKFQGWADMFLGTPAAGVEDVYAGVNGKLGKLSVGIVYHTFSADDGGADYGDEIDFVLNYPLHKAVKLQVKYAAYSADSFGVDTDKLWATLQLKL